MKKRFLSLTIIVLCLVLIGCDKNNSKNQEENAGGWTEQSAITKANIDEDALKAFNDANTSYTEMKLEPVALLGTQVVAGTNYMFLVKDTSNKNTAGFKIVVVYKNLEKKSEITKVTDFNINDYVNNNNKSNDNQLAGGWKVNDNDPKVTLDEDVQKAFDDAMQSFSGTGYKPIALLGTQVVAGTNYAILCLGTTTTQEPLNTINVLTIYRNLDGMSELTNIYTVDLSKFN